MIVVTVNLLHCHLHISMYASLALSISTLTMCDLQQFTHTPFCEPCDSCTIDCCIVLCWIPSELHKPVSTRPSERLGQSRMHI